jgi:DNA repair protein RadC
VFSDTHSHVSGHARLLAAKELMERVIAEPLYEGPALESPRAVRDFLQLLYAGRGHESFCVLYLDATHRLIVEEEVFRGTITQTSVYPREIVKQALQFNAAAVILAHNHPSGVAEPSRADEILTQTLKSALALLDVKVLDHLVVGSGTATSFAERGML